MTQEEIDALEEAIPEWKRTALVLQDDEEEAQKEESRFRKVKNKLGEKISSTEAAQKFYQSEEYDRIKKLRSEIKEFKSEVNEQIDNSPNPVIQGAQSVAGKIVNETPMALAVTKM